MFQWRVPGSPGRRVARSPGCRVARLPGDYMICFSGGFLGRRVAGSTSDSIYLVGCRVARSPGCHCIEGVWSLVKLKIKSMKGLLHDKIGQLLDEFTYRHRYGLSNGDVYHKLVYDIARLNNSTDNQK